MENYTYNYNIMCKERNNLYIDIERVKLGYNSFENYKKVFWTYSYYLDELTYKLSNIEKTIMPYEIMYRMQLYNYLMNSLPIDVIYIISTFGDIIDFSAFNYIENGCSPILEIM